MKLLLALFVMLICAAPAQASSRWVRYQQPLRLPDGPAASHVPAVRPALRLAERAWHLRGLSVDSEPVPPGLVSELGDIAGWAWAGDPVIGLHRHLLWLGGPELCETILHEAGHVAGRGHSSNPRSIMYPVQWVIRGEALIAFPGGRRRRVIQWSGVDRRCLRAYHALGSP